MAGRINNIHDKFIRQILADKNLAISFLREYLPSAITDVIDFETLNAQNTSYLSQELRSSFSDMVWQVQIVSGQKLHVCLLLEHKSYIYPEVAFQILDYLSSGYRKQVSEKKPPDLIIPILYYHGKQRWNLKPFEAYFEEFPQTLKKYLPVYETVFIDLEQISSEQILSLKNGLLRSAIMIQKHYFNPVALNDSILQILENLNPYLESGTVDTIFVYILQNKYLDHQRFKKNVEVLPPGLNTRIMSIYEELIQEGIEKGIEKGIQKGIEKGKVEVITRLLNTGKFSIEEVAALTGVSETFIKEIAGLR